MKLRFASKEYDCRLEWSSYGNGNTALVASDANDGSPVGVISVNPNMFIPSDLVAVKNYSENSGVLQSLIENGVVEEPQYYVHSGYVQIPICKIIGRKVNYPHPKEM